MAEHDTNNTKPAKPSLVLDIEKYKPYLDDPALSDADKREFLETVWAILLHCIEFGIRIEQAQKSCGKPHKASNSTPFDGRDAVKSDSQFLTNDFSDAVDQADVMAQEGARHGY